MERDRPPGYHQRAVVDGDFKLIAIAESDTNLIPWGVRGTFSKVRNVQVGTYAYDLLKDPGETDNVYVEGGEREERLLAALAAFVEGRGAESEHVPLDDATREKLRALGYIQ
jgi:hypothetical protein